ncbi:MAG: hypothetical protein M3Y55_12345 [Pseudomonadota bacterium]|nr:hypothetical protein [Pseudomonadota bacterium]
MPVDQETTETYARLKTDAKNRAAALLKIHAAMKTIPVQLAAADKNADALEIEAVQSAVDAEISFIEDQLMMIKISVADIHLVEKDQEFIVAQLAEFRKLIQGVSDVRTELLKQLADARDLKKKAGVAETAQQDTQDDALAELAVQEHAVAVFKNMDKLLADSRNDLEGATYEVGSRDAKGLKASQQSAKKMSVTGSYSTLTKIETEVAALLEKYRKKGFEDAIMKKLGQQAKDILDSAAAARKTMKQIEEVQGKVDALEIPDIDFGKAGKTLGITDKAQLAELEKILKGNFDEAEKKLDALGQKLSPKVKGKAMLTQLKNAHAV